MASIQYVHPQRLADGTIKWHWKPSPRLRKLGWTNLELGIGPAPVRGRKPVMPEAVAKAALDQNRKLEEWDHAGAAAVAANKPVPRKWLFGDLIDAFRASESFALKTPTNPEGIAQATRDNYELRFRQLSYWAKDGQLPIRAIDSDMVRELKKGLQEGGASPFTVASILSVLRLLLNWAKDEKLVKANPTDGVPIPTPPARSQKLDWRSVDTLAAEADAQAHAAGNNDFDSLPGRLLRVAFWSMQRRSDLGQLNRFKWRELYGADPRDLPALVNGKGQVWGFRLQQQKTGRWVDCPMPPFLHPSIEAAFEQSQWLFPHPLDPAKPMSDDLLRRRVKPLLLGFDLGLLEPQALHDTIAPMLQQQGLAVDGPGGIERAVLDVLTGDHRGDKPMQAFTAGLRRALKTIGFVDHQLRDLRRSGMSGIKDLGAVKSDVFAISGHPLDGQKRTMADVYMPPDTMAACRAIAAACRTLAAIEAREKEAGQ